MMLPFAMDGKILEAVHILCPSPTEMSACDVESGQKFVRNYLPSEFVALLSSAAGFTRSSFESPFYLIPFITSFNYCEIMF